MQRERLMLCPRWKRARGRIASEAFLRADDSVQDKRYSPFEQVNHPYSGNVHTLVKGIGGVNRVPSSGTEGDSWPLDDRLYAPAADAKAQNDPFREMALSAVSDQPLQARILRFDACYTSVDHGKWIYRSGGGFFTPLKSHRWLSLSQEQGYLPREAREIAGPQSGTSLE